MSTTNARTLFARCVNQDRLGIDESIVRWTAANKPIRLWFLFSNSATGDHVDCEMQVHDLPIVRGFLEDDADEPLPHGVAVLKRVCE